MGCIYQAEIVKLLHKKSLWGMLIAICISLAIVATFCVYIVFDESETNMSEKKKEVQNIVEIGEKSLQSNTDLFSFETNEYYSGMSTEKREAIANTVTIAKYKLENKWFDIPNCKYTMNELVDTLLKMVINIVSFWGILLSVNSYVSEKKSGSLKLLLISPRKRYKIYWAKLCAVISIMILVTLFLYGYILAIAFAFRSEQPFYPYISVANGKVLSIPFALYYLCILGIHLISIMVIIAIGTYFAILTNSITISCSIATAAYLISTALSGQKILLKGSELLRFIPFYHMGNISDFFPLYQVDESSIWSVGIDILLEPRENPIFSVSYLLILFVGIAMLGCDKFKRMDF